MIELFVEDKRVDLFEEESIELNKTVKNIRDIGAVFSDFSQGFTVPATKRNNAIFKHYYEPANLDPFNVLNRADANLYIGGVFYKRGSLQLEDVKMQAGHPYAYSVTFYGEIGALNKTFGEDTLQELDLSDYDHPYDSETILEGLQTGLANGVIYPLMSPKRAWIYDSSSNNHDARNIHFHTGSEGHAHGVHFYELKPAIPITAILSAIESRYNITFSGSFLSEEAITKLYMWLHNREGYLFEDQETQSSITKRHKLRSSNTSFTTNNWGYNTNNDEWEFNPVSATSARPLNEFKIQINNLSGGCILHVEEAGTLLKKFYLSSAQAGTTITVQMAPQGFTTYSFFLERTTANLTYDFDINVDADILSTAGGVNLNYQTQSIKSAATFSKNVITNNYTPELKIADFLDGIAKMHNLTITSTDGETFNLEPFDDYVGSGRELDFNDIIDTREHTIRSTEKYKKVSLKYQESEQIQQKQFRKANGRGYGDLTINFNFDVQDTIEVEAPFDQPYFTVLRDQDTNDYLDFPVYLSIGGIDDDGAAESYYGAPILFYHDGTQDISANTISFLDEIENQFEVSQIQSANTIADITIDSETLSSNFSEDANEYGLITQNDPANQNNLYASYWSGLVQDSFNAQARIAEVEAYLKLSTLWNLELRDIITWQGRKWRINTMNVDLKTGKAQMELITIQ